MDRDTTNQAKSKSLVNSSDNAKKHYHVSRTVVLPLWWGICACQRLEVSPGLTLQLLAAKTRYLTVLTRSWGYRKHIMWPYDEGCQPTVSSRLARRLFACLTLQFGRLKMSDRLEELTLIGGPAVRSRQTLKCCCLICFTSRQGEGGWASVEHLMHLEMPSCLQSQGASTNFISPDSPPFLQLTRRLKLYPHR